MKKYILYSLLPALAILIGSCGQDRTGEYYELIATKTWMYDVMEENYLYYQDLPSKDDLNFFKKPSEFLSSVISSKDQKNGVYFSHIDSVKTASRVSSSSLSFGMECAFLRNSNTGKYYARVLYVQKDSPAHDAGLQRGDWILDIDNNSLTTSNYSNYISQPTKAGSFHIARTDSDGNPDTLYVDMPAPRYVNEPSVYTTRNFTTASGKKVFYLMYNSFQTGDDENDLKAAFNEGMSESPQYVVLDLRYNPGGYISTAILLGTMLAPSEALGKNYVSLIQNDKLNKTTTYTLDATLLSGTSNFEFEHLYILTSGSTASAAELTINCLRPYLGDKLSQVGGYTFGKNVAQSLFTNEAYPQLEFWLTTSYASNSNGFYDFATNGLEPDYQQTENTTGLLGELGTEQDSLMIPVIYHIENGTFPTQQSETTTNLISRGKNPRSNLQVISNSVANKPKRTLIDLLK